MTNVKDYFSGNFLKAEDCKGGEIVEFLSEGTMEEIRSPEGKIKTILNYQVNLDGKERTFSPNRANGSIFIDAWGEDDKLWIGKKFKVSLIKVQVFGKLKDSIVAEPIKEEPQGAPVEKVK